MDVYCRAYALALDIHKRSLKLPKFEQYALADQMRRASKSICANIAEGFGKHHSSAAEFRRFLAISTGSCNEMTVWIQFCIDLSYLNEKTGKKLIEDYIIVLKMLRKLSKNWKT